MRIAILIAAALLVGCGDPHPSASFRTDCEPTQWLEETSTQPVEIAEGHIIRMECRQRPSIECKVWGEPPYSTNGNTGRLGAQE